MQGACAGAHERSGGMRSLSFLGFHGELTPAPCQVIDGGYYLDAVAAPAHPPSDPDRFRAERCATPAANEGEVYRAGNGVEHKKPLSAIEKMIGRSCVNHLVHAPHHQ